MKYNDVTEFEEINTNIKDDDILLTVWCVTHNHEEYMLNTLSGFVAQRTNFKYRVVVFDDASTDGTADLIRKFTRMHPDLFSVYIAKENIYQHPDRNNIIRLLIEREAQGKYMAICEGDDCWIDRKKLQIQVDFLEEHGEYSFTMHNSIMLDYQKHMIHAFNKQYEQDMDLGCRDMLLRTLRLATASLVYRRKYEVMPELFLDIGIGDWPRLLYLISQGKGYYFDRTMSIYRYGTENSWTLKQAQSLERQLRHLLNMSDFLKNYNDYTESKYRDDVVFALHQRIYRFMDSFERESANEENNLRLIDRIYEEHDSQVLKKTNLLELISRRKAEGHCPDIIKKSINGFNHVLIWGTGDGATRIASQMNNDGIAFDGFIVDDEKNLDIDYMEKKIYRFDDFPFDKKETIIIVSIFYSFSKGELEEILIEKDIDNYVIPFVIPIGI